MASNKKSGFRANFATLILLALGGSIIYGLPYYRYYYYDTYMELFNLTNTQIGVLGSAYGLLGMVSYIIGGVLGDKFNAKKLVCWSLILTGAAGFLHLFTKNYTLLIAIYALWGITSLLTFWPACVKMVRMQATDEEQGKTYGTFEGVRGAFNAGHLAIATAIFAYFEHRALAEQGVRYGFIFYSVAGILVGILLMFMLKDPKDMENLSSVTDEQKFSIKDLGYLLKLPSMWIIIGMVFCSYTFNISLSYYNPYTVNILGASAVIAALVTTSTQYIRPICSTLGGFVSDKVGKGNVMLTGFILMIAGQLLIIRAGSASSGAMMGVGVLIVYIGMYFCFGLHHGFTADAGVPMRMGATAAGLICTLGYLPEVIDPIIAGRILDNNDTISGYHTFFYFMLACAVVGMALAIVWNMTYGKKVKDAKRGTEEK